MKYLLDTHVFIWATSAPERLSPKAKLLIQNPDNTILLSIASIWEMQIKVATGKLTFPVSLPQVIAAQQKNRFRFFPIKLTHIFQIANLPDHHKDPFDRLLIAQSMVAQIPLITRDEQIIRYPVTTVW